MSPQCSIIKSLRRREEEVLTIDLCVSVIQKKNAASAQEKASIPPQHYPYILCLDSMKQPDQGATLRWIWETPGSWPIQQPWNVLLKDSQQI